MQNIAEILLALKKELNDEDARKNEKSDKKPKEEKDDGVNDDESEDASSPDFYLDDTLERSLYASSPFHQHFNPMLQKIKEEKQNAVKNPDSKANIYFNESLAEHIPVSYMSFAVMWSALILSKLRTKITRLSNANAEAFNKNAKYQVLQKQLASSLGRFAEKMRDYLDSLCTEAELGLEKKERVKGAQLQNSHQRKRKMMRSLRDRADPEGEA